MSYRVVFTSSFKKSVKHLEKRFPRVKEDVRIAIQVLLQEPKLGVVIPGGGGIRKLRVRSSDQGRGKSGGYRLLYYVEDQQQQALYVLLLYAKSDRDDVTRKELHDLLDAIESEST